MIYFPIFQKAPVPQWMKLKRLAWRQGKIAGRQLASSYQFAGKGA